MIDKLEIAFRKAADFLATVKGYKSLGVCEHQLSPDLTIKADTLVELQSGAQDKFYARHGGIRAYFEKHKGKAHKWIMTNGRVEFTNLLSFELIEKAEK